MFTANLILLPLTLYTSYVAGESSKLEEFKSMFYENIEKFKNDKPPSRTEEFVNYKQTDCEDAGDFDFIIIGAGTSGTIIANRLSENPNWRILLLEAGGVENNLSLIPAVYDKISSNYLWPYRTVKQTRACFDLQGHQCSYKKGKSLGGTSAMDGIFYSRGSHEDYDKWGNIGWSYNNVLPYFKKSEKARNFIPDWEYHGYTGESTISDSEYHHPLLAIVKSVNKEFGLDNLDYNGKSQMGFSKLQLLIKNGKRLSNNQKFLEPIRERRTNLVVLKKAFSTKIEFKEKTAYRVKFLHNDTCKYAAVNKEIILSAGVINSPQLLQLSGIGPKNLLERFKINVLADLPVGENFRDAVCFNSGVPINTNLTFTIKSTDEAMSSYLGGSGPLSTPAELAVSHHSINKNATKPDFAFMYGFEELDLRHYMNNSISIETQSIMTIKPELLYPKSSGTVQIKSADPFDFPDINPRLFQDKSDFQNFLYAMRLLVKYSESEAFKTVDGFIKTDVFSKCMTKGLKNKKLWVCVIKEQAMPCKSGFGTCRMGASPSESVVDHDLRVHGINKLRVADASIIPESVGSKCSAAVMMIGEKVAELIKETYSK